MTEQHVVKATQVIEAPADVIFELIADPARQPAWDGNDNLTSADPGQRMEAVGDVFRMTLISGKTRENHVVEFEEGRLAAWRPSPIGKPQPGHLWRWELAPSEGSRTEVTHTYDWSELHDPERLHRARNTTSANLDASILRLKKVAESAHHGTGRPSRDFAARTEAWGRTPGSVRRWISQTLNPAPWSSPVRWSTDQR